MKSILLAVSFLASTLSFAQDISATTADGKKVILKPNKTWEYFNGNTNTTNSCVVSSDHKEPKGDKKNQTILKRTGATVEDFKKHVSIDLGVNEKDIVLLELSEQLGNGIYIICVNGTKMKYRRTGSVFRKDNEDVLNMKNE